MRSDFDAAIGALFASLNLPAPPPGADPRASLVIDGFTVSFDEAADGRRLVISASAGRLSADPRRRTGQIRTLLKAGPAFLRNNRAGFSLDDSSEADAKVMVRAVFPYRIKRAGALDERVQDVLQLLEFATAELRTGGNRPAPRAVASAPPSESVIFRP